MPSITSTTLTLLTESDLAISWAILVILLALVPGAGWISNLVTTGPGKTDSTEASIPNSSNLVSNNEAIWLSSSWVRDEPSSSALSNNEVLGITVFSCAGSILVSFVSTSVIFGSLVFGRSGCSGSLFEVLIGSTDDVFTSVETIFAFKASASFCSATFKDLASFNLFRLVSIKIEILCINFTE